MTTYDETPPPVDEPPPADPAGEAFRAQPNDVEAERWLLSAMLHPASGGRSAIDAAVLGGLKPKHLYSTSHEAVYEAIVHLYEAGVEVDPAAVVARLRDVGAIPGPVRLDVLTFDLFALPAIAANAAHHVNKIKDAYTRRAGIRAAAQIRQICETAETGDANEVMNAVQAIVDDLVDDAAFGRRGVTVADALDEVLDLMEAGNVVTPTCWPDLNRIIGGVAAGSLYVVAGETGGGKTIMGVQWALYLAHRLGMPVAYCTPEMTRRQVIGRIFAQMGRVEQSKILRGGDALTDRDWTAINVAAGRLRTEGPNGGPVPVYIDDAGSIALGDILAAYRATVREFGSCPVIFVDFLQMVTPPSKGKGENRQVEVAAIAYGLAALAKTLGVAIVALAQFNRGPGAAERRPRKSDLRESGVIEIVAAVIILLYRWKSDPSIIEWIVDKNRQGPVTVAPPDDDEGETPEHVHPTGRFDGAFARITSLTHETDEQTALAGVS